MAPGLGAQAATRRTRRRGKRRRAMRVLLGAGAALMSVCGADKAAYSLDLMGIDSGTAYTVEVKVGTTDSANTFRLIADTGSSNDAVLGEGCCGSGATTTYSCDDSSTCSASSTSATLAFAGATIAGHYVTDTWSSTEFGTLTKEFLVIDKQDTFYRSEYDGITGLAYKALAKPKDSPKTSFYENLVASKSGIPDTFGMQLCGIMQPILTQTNYSLHAGQWLVGGSEGPKGETYYKDSLLYTPIAQEAWYVVVVTDIGFDGQSLGLPCSSYNNPQAIIDSGTSNIAFPSDVYNALMTLIKAATKKTVPEFADTYFDYRKSCCGKDYCDPTDSSLALLNLPSIYITLALQEEGSSDTTSHYTVEIPPEYYFRPEMNGANTDTPCRAMGVAESTAIVLGDVFMDGLFAFHDRAKGKIGLAVTDNCPNGVKSTKKVTKATSKKDDWCDCFSDSLKSKSSLVRHVPWGSGCFFMPWWMYVVIASIVVVLACVGILGYWYWKGRQDKMKGRGGPAAVSAAPLISTDPTEVHVTVPGTATVTETKPDSTAAAQTSKRRQSSRTDRSTDDVENHYTVMASPRQPIDSGGSSIALLTSSDDVSSGVHTPARTKSQQQLDTPQGRTVNHGSATRETSGFLL